MKYCCLILLLLFLACSEKGSSELAKTNVSPFEKIADQKAGSIIKKAIEYAGGLENWQSIQKLSYTKEFKLLTENGEVEKGFEQTHHYQYDPTIIDILSIENGDTVHTSLSDGQYQRMINGGKSNVPEESLKRAINSSLYVIGIPFKLLDPGAVITYLGVDTLNNKPVDIIQVAYNSDKFENHSSTEIWKYFFDQETAAVVANWVQTGDHSNIIENLEFERVGGILFHKKRKSYRLDSLGNKAYLRADYYYGNYSVE